MTYTTTLQTQKTPAEVRAIVAPAVFNLGYKPVESSDAVLMYRQPGVNPIVFLLLLCFPVFGWVALFFLANQPRHSLVVTMNGGEGGTGVAVEATDPDAEALFKLL